jgi:hypothetical protein
VVFVCVVVVGGTIVCQVTGYGLQVGVGYGFGD